MASVKGLVMGGAFCLLLSCTGGETDPTSLRDNISQEQDPVVLEVQGTLYAHSDFDSYVAALAGEETWELSEETRSRLFDHFVEEKVLLAEAHNQNLALTQVEKKNYLVKLSQRFEEEKSAIWDAEETSSLFERLLV